MEQNTPEWHAFRRNKIGASDAPIILGISPWKTVYQLWEEKVYGIIGETSPAMARGKMLEESARVRFEQMTGLSVFPKVIVHAERTWQMASLDGITFDGSTIVEIKCPSAETHQKAKDGIIADHYMAQIQHQYAVTDAQKALYFSFNGDQGVIVDVKRDDAFIGKMIEKEERFYEQVMNQEAPDLVERDYVERNDKEWNTLTTEWKLLHEKMQLLQIEEEEIRAKIQEISMQKNSKGNGITLTKYQRQGTVDYMAIPALIGVDLNKYRKPPSQRWRISSCSKKEDNDIPPSVSR